MLKSILNRRWVFSLRTSLLIILGASVLLTFALLQIQPIGIKDVWSALEKSGGMVFLLNHLPILLCMVLMFFLCGNTVIAVYSVSFIVTAMSLVNRFKLLFRRNPFFPWDLSLGGEVMEISKSFNSSLFILVGAFVLVFALSFFVLFRMIKNKKPNVKLRISGFIATFIVILLVNATLFTNTGIYNSIYVNGNIYNPEDRYNSKGFLYSFIYDFNKNKIEKPEGYNKAEFTGMVSGQAESLTKPNVVIILSEAFSEIPLRDDFDFTGYTDPLQNYRRLLPDSIRGTMISPGFGGGTADTEFDILTGLSTRDFRGMPYTFMLITKPFASIVSVLNSLGYANVAIHPGMGWFYNRQNVYEYLGFSRFITQDDFNPDDRKREYMSETATFDRLIGEFDNHIKSNPDTPFLAYCATIQNHGPYTDKYEAKQNFNTTLPLKESDILDISNYFVGLADADRELGRLTDYLDELSQPTVLLYYGDHKPYFSPSAYEALTANVDDQLTKLHTNPYIIWQNKAAKDTMHVKFNPETTISDFYVGAALLEMMGFEKIDPFFENLCKMREEYPVILENNVVDKEKTTLDQFPDIIKQYQRWEYFRIFDQEMP